jgi:hypothetical protein
MGASEPIALQAVRDICIDFCEQTLIWEETLDPITAIPNILTYDLDAPPGVQCMLIDSAWFEKDRMEVLYDDSAKARPEMFNTQFQNADTNPGRPTALLQNADNTFTINRLPAERERGAFTVRGVFKPTRASSGVADIVFQDYAPAIGKGAVAYLMKMPFESFTNPALAQAFDVEYANAVHKAKIRANKNLGRANLQVQLRRI